MNVDQVLVIDVVLIIVRPVLLQPRLLLGVVMWLGFRWLVAAAPMAIAILVGITANNDLGHLIELLVGALHDLLRERLNVHIGVG